MYFLLQEPFQASLAILAHLSAGWHLLLLDYLVLQQFYIFKLFNLNLTRKQEAIWTADAAYQMRSLLQ